MAGPRPPRRRAPRLPKPHQYNPDRKTWLCKECPLPSGHQVHSEAAIKAAEEKRAERIAEEARRVGERPA